MARSLRCARSLSRSRAGPPRHFPEPPLRKGCLRRGPFAARIGCDLELIESRHPAFLSDYFATDEQALVAHTAPNLRDLTVTLLWSGKEGALKAMHLGLRLDTRSLNVCLSDSAQPARDFWLDSYPLRLLNSHCNEHGSPDLWHPFQ